MGGIDGKNTPQSYAKTEIAASKNTFHSFHAFLCSMDHTQKIHSNTFRSSFKMTKIIVTNIFYHFLFAVSLGNKAPKMFQKIRLDR